MLRTSRGVKKADKRGAAHASAEDPGRETPPCWFEPGVHERDADGECRASQLQEKKPNTSSSG